MFEKFSLRSLANSKLTPSSIVAFLQEIITTDRSRSAAIRKYLCMVFLFSKLAQINLKKDLIINFQGN